MSIRYLYEIESGRRMTAVQQSVPAWLIFGMFFVVIPLAGVLIQERNDGTLPRLATLGVSPFTILGGKLVAFMGVNWVQLLADAPGRALARAVAGRRCAVLGSAARLVLADGVCHQRGGGRVWPW